MSSVIFGVNALMIGFNWISVISFGHYVDASLIVSSVLLGVCAIGFFLLGEKTLSKMWIINVLAIKSFFSFAAFKNAAFFETNYFAYMIICDLALIALCYLDHYGRRIVDYCRYTLGLPLRG